MKGLIVAAPRWLLLAALVFAPWAYGATRPWAVDILNALLGGVLLLWAAGWVARRAWPEVHPALAVVAILLVLQAWWMALNARYDYDLANRQFVELHQWWSGAPGSFHQTLSLPAALQITMMLGAACFVCDLARRAVWRKRLLWTLALTGVSLAAFGLIQRMAGAQAIFWSGESMGDSFFATYRYHSNAGAFLNLVWPIAAGFLAAGFRRLGGVRGKVFWSAALILCFAGVLVNASRAATALAVLLLGLWLGWMIWQSLRGRLEGINPAVALVTAGLLLVLVTAVAALAGLDVSARRWAKFGEEVTDDNPRLIVARVCLDMTGLARSPTAPPALPRAGWWGFGPGTFPTVFPYFTNELGDKISGVWLHAHQDYLQTLVEWGYAGGVLWAVVIFGGVFFSWRTLRQQRDVLSLRERAAHFGMFTAVLGTLLHALMDFPLQIASIQLYFVTLLGLLWGSPHWLGERARRGSRGEEEADEE